jgi:hypothetical protein
MHCLVGSVVWMLRICFHENASFGSAESTYDSAVVGLTGV